MKRYQVQGTKLVPTLHLSLDNMENSNEKKVARISTNDLISILYIDNLADIGTGKEYVIRGRVAYISQSTTRCVLNDVPVYTISIDASREMESKLYHVKTSNILDVNEPDYWYCLDEDREKVPKEIEYGVKLQNIDHKTKNILQEEYITTPRKGESYFHVKPDA